MDIIPAETVVLQVQPKGRRRGKYMELLGTPMDAIVSQAVDHMVKRRLHALYDEFEEAFNSEVLAYNASLGVLRYTLFRLAEGVSAQEATVPLNNGLCPVSAETLNRYAQSAAERCRKEIQAVQSLVRSLKGTSVEQVKQRVFEMPSLDDSGVVEEHHDNDPVNGLYANKMHAEFRAARDLALSKQDKEKLAEIDGKIVELLNVEASRGNPRAIFELGVRCASARGEEADKVRGAQLLMTAERMGVRRASSFLLSHFPR